MRKWRWVVAVVNYLGGGFSRAVVNALIVAFSVIVFGLTPAEALVYVWNNPPGWLLSGWTRLLLVIVGLVAVAGLLRFNLWDQQQSAVDSLAEDVSWAISQLLNRPHPTDPAVVEEFVGQWDVDFRDWCRRVSAKLENRAFFTRADQLHFDKLGFVEPVRLTGHARLDWLASMLRLKFDRLRDVINSVQVRRR